MKKAMFKTLKLTACAVLCCVGCRHTGPVERQKEVGIANVMPKISMGSIRVDCIGEKLVKEFTYPETYLSHFVIVFTGEKCDESKVLEWPLRLNLKLREQVGTNELNCGTIVSSNMCNADWFYPVASYVLRLGPATSGLHPYFFKPNKLYRVELEVLSTAPTTNEVQLWLCHASRPRPSSPTPNQASARQ